MRVSWGTRDNEVQRRVFAIKRQHGLQSRPLLTSYFLLWNVERESNVKAESWSFKKWLRSKTLKRCIFHTSLCLCWGFSYSATSAAELEVCDGTHEYGAARLQPWITPRFREGDKKHRCYFHRADSRRLNISLNLKVLTVGRFPVRTEMRVEAAWQSLTWRSLSQLSMAATEATEWIQNSPGWDISRQGEGAQGGGEKTRYLQRAHSHIQTGSSFLFSFLPGDLSRLKRLSFWNTVLKKIKYTF